MAVHLARRRARKLRAESDFTVEEFEAVCEKYGNACLRCGDENTLLTPDHIVRLSVRGSNLIENIQPLCGNCNSWKNVNVSTTGRRRAYWAKANMSRVPGDDPERGEILRFFKV